MQLMQKSSCSSAQEVSSCRRAHAAQHKGSTHAAHAEEFMQLSTRGQLMKLMQLMQESSCSSAQGVSSCRTTHAAHAEELMQLM